MILESAFNYLPEIFTAARHPEVDYEATLVGAFALAVLQELNARNCPNPLAAIRQEVPYRQAGFGEGGGATRNLRADLFVNLQPLRLGSSRFADQGHRFYNWIEAKYYRAGSPGQNGTTNIAQLCADIIRLSTLVPLRPPWKAEQGWPSDKEGTDFTGRYMLHVYSGDPTHQLSLRRLPKHRRWALGLITPGRSELTITSADLQKEGPTFLKYLAADGLDFSLRIQVTNQIVSNRIMTKSDEVFQKKGRLWHSGLGSDATADDGPTFILSRFNEFEIILNKVEGEDFTFTQHIHRDRRVDVSQPGRISDFREAFGTRIGKRALSASEKTAPVAEENVDLADENTDLGPDASSTEVDLGGEHDTE
jgi:hypothetical protein